CLTSADSGLQLDLGDRAKRCLSESPAPRGLFSRAEDKLKRRMTKSKTNLSALPTAVYRTLVVHPGTDGKHTFPRKPSLWPLVAISSSRTPSTFHPRAQRNAFRRRGVRQQRRLFAHENPRLRRSPNSN